jgi:hypothetical protein
MALLEPAERAALLHAARRSLEHGFERGHPLLPDPAEHSPALRVVGASFVTLERDGALRGCMGTLEAVRPVVVDVARNAFAAAFRDPRFAPLTGEEFADLDLHVSLLSASEPLVFVSHEDLIAQLRPGVDGLTLEDSGRRGTFLPAVWEKVPDPREFLRQLKRKAGLPPDHESPLLRAWRYTVVSVD